jgi:hypothetical protein
MSDPYNLPGYDAWKLRTPEDEPYRDGRWHADNEGQGCCLSCRAEGINWDEPAEDGDCYECGKPLDYDGQRDPDDARDDMQDREWSR